MVKEPLVDICKFAMIDNSRETTFLYSNYEMRYIIAALISRPNEIGNSLKL